MQANIAGTQGSQATPKGAPKIETFQWNCRKAGTNFKLFIIYPASNILSRSVIGYQYPMDIVFAKCMLYQEDIVFQHRSYKDPISRGYCFYALVQ